MFLTAEEAGRAETIAHGVDYLRIAAFAFVFMGVLQVILGAFRGAGNTKTALVSPCSGCGSSGSRSPPTSSSSPAGETGIWVGVVVGDLVGALTATAWFTRGTWKSSILEDGDRGQPATPEGESVAE